jgi:hypothetical protein
MMTITERKPGPFEGGYVTQIGYVRHDRITVIYTAGRIRPDWMLSHMIDLTGGKR